MIPEAADPSRVGRLEQAFTEMTGRAPAGMWRAPGRVNLIGEHTDYNGGFVLPIAIDRDTLAAGTVRGDGLLRVWSLQQEGGPETAALPGLSPGAVKGWAAYITGVAWALIGFGHPVKGADLVIDSNVPLGAGLSSSAALELASGLAIASLSGVEIESKNLALAAQKAENDFVGVPCGIMDQLVSATATSGHALLIDTLAVESRAVPFRPQESRAQLIVIDTRVSHELADGEYAARRRGCEEAARILGVEHLREIELQGLEAALSRLPAALVPLVRHVVTENDRVLRATAAFEQPDLGQAGKEMNASHDSLRDDYRVSSAELDVAVEAARRSGALGARMTGGGFGGSAIALVREQDSEELRREVTHAFQAGGFEEPAFFAVNASAGCSRILP